MELTGLKQDGAFVKEQFSVSERQACKLFAVDRSTYRYEARPDRNAQLRREMTELAHQKPRYGYRRLHAVLTRRGYAISVMRLYRIYREEGLAVWRLKRKRLSRPAASQALHVRQNQEWALNFVADTISTGRGIRVLTIVDAFTRECVVLEVDSSLSSRLVTRTLDRIIEQIGTPEVIRCDKGPELTSLHILGWREEKNIRLVHIQPGKPMQNVHVESFNGRFRDECLNASWFRTLADAKHKDRHLAKGI